jgi:hypothetical protein
MPRGFFSGSAIVLMERAPAMRDVHAALKDFPVLGVRPAPKDAGWMGGEALVIDYLPEVNGKVAIDVVDRPWPDQMGDPKTEMELFGAWSMGMFGPGVFPGALARAVQQPWGSEVAAELAGGHAAFVRVRTSYIMGANDDSKILPEDYDAAGELMYLTKVARKLLRLPGALCYFNPNGETLHTAESMNECLKRHQEQDVWPSDLWCNVRMFRLDSGWTVMDTIGFEQFFTVTDLEACFTGKRIDPSEVGGFLRNIGQYLIDNGMVIEDGHTVDGPGGVKWRCRACEESLAPAPRPTLRFFPEDGSRPPKDLLKTKA